METLDSAGCRQIEPENIIYRDYVHSSSLIGDENALGDSLVDCLGVPTPTLIEL